MARQGKLPYPELIGMAAQTLQQGLLNGVFKAGVAVADTAILLVKYRGSGCYDAL